jgi:hypothetical protein
MRRLLILCSVFILLAACTQISVSTLQPATQVSASATLPPASTFTPVPTFTSIPQPTSTPSDSLGTIGLDFIALLCNADWMNGAVHLTPCPNSSADLSAGSATAFHAPTKEFTDITILRMVPNANALFLRYPAYKVSAGDRFRTTLLCENSAPCDVQFALEYYDADNKYHDSFQTWDYKTGDQPIAVDVDLSPLASQKVDFVLALRLSHQIQDSEHDNGLWIAPHIYRPIR